MGDATRIEWTDASWNPLRYKWDPSGRKPPGHICMRISPGCDYCYASALQRRYYGGAPYLLETHHSKHNLAALVRDGVAYLDPVALEQPLRWRRPRRVFLSSMTDVFLGEWPIGWLDALWAVMAQTPQHTYQVLTKRPASAAAYLTGPSTPARIDRLMAERAAAKGWCLTEMEQWPLPNVWLGVSVETNAYAWRVQELAKAPAAIHWVSAEPLLGPLDTLPMPLIDWLVIGGESNGPPERRLVERCAGHTRDRVCWWCGGTGWQPKPDAALWVGELIGRAHRRGVPVLFKQWGGPTPKAGGRLILGSPLDAYPDVA